jgi:hypothetical protein
MIGCKWSAIGLRLIALAAAVGLVSLPAHSAAPNLTPAVAGSATPVNQTLKGLLTHRGVYELKLAGQKDGANINKVEGRLVYEFTGSACEGFSTQFRFVTRIESDGGEVKLSDMRTSSFEDGPGTSFDFVNQTYISSILTEDSKGTAERKAAAIDVALTKPKTDKVTVPGDALFPTQHLARLIEAAKAGDKVIEIKLYDGTEGGGKIDLTTSVIGKELPLDDQPADEAATKLPELATVRHWPITVSYFAADKPAGTGEASPDYQLSFILYENGVTRHMTLDYGDFSLEGRLVDLKPIASKACE